MCPSCGLRDVEDEPVGFGTPRSIADAAEMHRHGVAPIRHDQTVIEAAIVSRCTVAPRGRRILASRASRAIRGRSRRSLRRSSRPDARGRCTP
jgi:hypothetical protein